MADQETERELTFGEKLVGLSFNPSGDENVIKIKKAAAAYADAIEDVVKNTQLDDFQRDLFNRSTYTILDSQMQAVKAATWRK